MFPQDPQEPRMVAWLRNARVRRMLILGTLWTFIAVILIAFHFVLLPFALAILLAFIIEPIVEQMTRRPIFGWTLPRPLAVAAIYTVVIAASGFFGSWAVAQIGREIANLGAVSSNLIREGEQLVDTLLSKAVVFSEQNHIPVSREEIHELFTENMEILKDELTHNTAQIFLLGRQLVGITFRAIFGLFLVLMLTAVLTMDRERIQRFFYSLVPPEYQPAYRAVISGMSIGLAGVVRGQVLICLTNGILTFLGLWLFGVKLPLLLALIATVFSLIPIFGSILSTLPIVAIALTDSVAKGVFTLLWIIGIHLVEANLLNPKIMGDAAKIHPVVVVFALIVGERTAGLIGALFAVPIASVVLTMFRFLHARALSGVREAVEEGRLPAAEAPTGDLADRGITPAGPSGE